MDVRAVGWTLVSLSATVSDMAATVATYPDYREPVDALVKQHRKLKNDRLRLAVYFSPAHGPKRDICLFELLDDFGGGQIDPDKKLFTFAYGSTPGFPLPDGVSLRMVLTNPNELDKAIQENWKRVEELRKARKTGKADVIYADAEGRKFWDEIR